MKVIVNATPLIALALVNRLDLLPRIFDEVIVPTSVYNEVIHQGSERPGSRLIAQANWLQIMSPKTTSTLEPLLLGLDQGELDVLLLALEQHPDWVIIDERQARRVARVMKLPVKGTVGILLAAGLADLYPKEELLNDLDEMIRQDIRIHPQLREWLREELESAGK